MLLAATDYLRPGSLDEAVGALAGTPGARVLAGGQSLLNVLKHRAASVSLLVDVSRLAELRTLTAGDDGSLSVGAGCTYAQLAQSQAVAATHRLLGEVAAATVDRQVRNRGTIGGNACFADPAGNFPPLLVALGAAMEVAGPGGSREVAAEEFFRGAYRTALEPGEILRAIVLPPLGDAGVGYRSLLLAADSWALARAAVLVRANGTIAQARVVLGCVAGKPVRARAMEERLNGQPATAEAVADAASAADFGLTPPSDSHASGEYRLQMARVMARRAVLDAIGTGDGRG